MKPAGQPGRPHADATNVTVSVDLEPVGVVKCRSAGPVHIRCRSELVGAHIIGLRRVTHDMFCACCDRPLGRGTFAFDIDPIAHVPQAPFRHRAPDDRTVCPDCAGSAT
jgi:hypothetical protein